MASAPPLASPSQSIGVKLLQSLRVVLHIGVIIALTIRSAKIGNALHPYERALANEWIHLIFYVDTVKTIPTFVPNENDNKTMIVPVTLPNFLLESEEEIAANVDEEVFSTGFPARASSYPVGMLFTIEETKKHLHGALANYFRLPEVALDSLLVADGNETTNTPPWPELTVWKSWEGDSVPHKFVLKGNNDTEWPLPLQFNHTNSTRTRHFFDKLDGMELLFRIGMKENKRKELVEWWVRLAYDLQSQGHLQVSINFGLQRKKRLDSFDHQHIPSIMFDQNTTFNWCLVALLLVYQTIEFVLKWWHSQTAILLLSPRHSRRQIQRMWQTFKREVNDFWFWFLLVLNSTTIACVLDTWVHIDRLYLGDTLCIVFAMCCAMQWTSLVRYLRFTARFHILGLTLTRGLPRVAEFLVGVLPIFVGYVLFGTIMFGATVPRFQSAWTTATTLFSVANGDEIHDTFNAVAYTPWIGPFYVYSYLIIFSYVVLMVCIGIIEDSFFSAVFPASWPSLHQTENKDGAERETVEEQEDIEERR